MGDDVACLDIAPIPDGRQRCRFLAVGCYDSTVRILGVDPEDGLRALATQVSFDKPNGLMVHSIF